MDAERKGPGRPSEYKPEFCDTAIEMGREGKTEVQIAAALGFSRTTFLTWKQTHPEFKEAMGFARDLAQALLEGKGFDGLEKPGFNANLYNKMMAARFPDDYRERKDVGLSAPDGGPVKTEVRIEVVGVEPQ